MPHKQLLVAHTLWQSSMATHGSPFWTVAYHSDTHLYNAGEAVLDPFPGRGIKPASIALSSDAPSSGETSTVGSLATGVGYLLKPGLSYSSPNQLVDATEQPTADVWPRDCSAHQQPASSAS